MKKKMKKYNERKKEKEMYDFKNLKILISSFAARFIF